MSLTPETEISYTTIIDSILAASDLNTISEKRIRKGLQAAVDYDITPLKEPIKALIMTRFDKFMAENNPVPRINGHAATVNGQSSEVSPEPKPKASEPKQELSPSPLLTKNNLKRESVEDGLSDVTASPAANKKRKTVPVDDDAAFAAKLQAEENGRARATRGGVNKKPTSTKKKVSKNTPKKKTSHKVKAEDDSDLEGSGSEAAEKKINRSGGFHVSLRGLDLKDSIDDRQKPMTLSAPLSALLDGEAQLSRPQTVKGIWAYVKKHDLQDPNDKRMLLCDGRMKAVFKQDKVHMFTMNKILGNHLYPADEE